MNVKEFLSQFKIHNVPVCALVGRSYFEIPKKLEKFASKRPSYIGKCIAHVRGPVLIPSIDFLQYVGRHCKKKVVVNKDGAWLFICGRDVFSKSVVSTVGSPVPDDFVVVMNEYDEALGYGKFTSDKIIVKRLFDIGDLLRRERKSRKVKAF